MLAPNSLHKEQGIFRTEQGINFKELEVSTAKIERVVRSRFSVQTGVLRQAWPNLVIQVSSAPSPDRTEGSIMTEYVVGLRLGNRTEVLTIEAEDALIAALKAKHNHPEALISYVRKSNRRGDRRNPHRKE